ncbi:hypothetical protein HNY73_015380 [Argiope bruennichi]|uniref:Uncharacterized protein n=1 Tax=Argiope bruennichi TaxID=94029 RepID=A0A8T0ES59_ARGBR|nr:hypothetical protein HNY73_015380 [Argiope bruennichi]
MNSLKGQRAVTTTSIICTYYCKFSILVLKEINFLCCIEFSIGVWFPRSKFTLVQGTLLTVVQKVQLELMKIDPVTEEVLESHADLGVFRIVSETLEKLRAEVLAFGAPPHTHRIVSLQKENGQQHIYFFYDSKYRGELFL